MDSIVYLLIPEEPAPTRSDQASAKDLELCNGEERATLATKVDVVRLTRSPGFACCRRSREASALARCRFCHASWFFRRLSLRISGASPIHLGRPSLSAMMLVPLGQARVDAVLEPLQGVCDVRKRCCISTQGFAR